MKHELLCWEFEYFELFTILLSSHLLNLLTILVSHTNKTDYLIKKTFYPTLKFLFRFRFFLWTQAHEQCRGKGRKLRTFGRIVTIMRDRFGPFQGENDTLFLLSPNYLPFTIHAQTIYFSYQCRPKYLPGPPISGFSYPTQVISPSSPCNQQIPIPTLT